jgi:hypothetical protein
VVTEIDSVESGVFVALHTKASAGLIHKQFLPQNNPRNNELPVYDFPPRPVLTELGNLAFSTHHIFEREPYIRIVEETPKGSGYDRIGAS